MNSPTYQMSAFYWSMHFDGAIDEVRYCILDQVVQQTIAVVLDFMTAFVPVFATTVVVAGGDATAMGFYESGFSLWSIWCSGCLADGLVPLIRIYVVMGLLNYVMEEGRFSKLTDLLENMVSWALKILTSVVLGLNIIKNAIVPSQIPLPDRR